MASNESDAEETSEVNRTTILDNRSFFEDGKGNWVYHSLPGLRGIYKGTIINSPEQRANFARRYTRVVFVWGMICFAVVWFAWLHDYWWLLFTVPVSLLGIEMTMQHVLLKNFPKSDVPFPWKNFIRNAKKVHKMSTKEENPPHNAFGFFYVGAPQWTGVYWLFLFYNLVHHFRRV